MKEKLFGSEMAIFSNIIYLVYMVEREDPGIEARPSGPKNISAKTLHYNARNYALYKYESLFLAL